MVSASSDAARSCRPVAADIRAETDRHSPRREPVGIVAAVAAVYSYLPVATKPPKRKETH